MKINKLLRFPQRRLTLSYASIMGLLYIFSGINIYYFTSRHHDRTIKQEITFIASTIHNRLEAKLIMPDRLDSSVTEVFPDFCIAPACQLTSSSQRHITNTFATIDRYYLMLVDNQGKIRATAGILPAGIVPQKFSDTEVWITGQDPQGKLYRQYATIIHGQRTGSSYDTWGRLYIGRSTEDLYQSLQSLQNGLLLGFPLVLLAIGGVSWYLADRAMKPLYLAYEQQQAFSANVAHELRTPLAINQLNLDKYIDRFSQPAELALALVGLREQNVRLASIVTDLLLLAQLERTSLTATLPSSCILDEVVEDVVEELSVLHSRHQIAIHIPAAIQPVAIQGDRERITRLVYNLVENACKYTPDGGMISISIESNTRSYILQIQDSGVGIAAAELGDIFQRFHQTGVTNQAGGMGLGLALVQAIANLYGAKVGVSSEVDRGSTFRVDFPRYE
jgi:signal transduction histidine kinase